MKDTGGVKFNGVTELDVIESIGMKQNHLVHYLVSNTPYIILILPFNH